MFEGLQNRIAERLFSKLIQQAKKEIEMAQKDARDYYDISHENITALVANALSILAFGDGAVAINLDGRTTKRTEYLNNIAQKEFTKAKRKISAALGTSMIASIPYSIDNGLGRKIYIDTITKDRFYITGAQGDEITEITALTDIVEIKNQKYMRWTDYSVENGLYIIRNKATNENGEEISIQNIAQWAEIQQEISIGGVDRLPVAFYSCPAGGRRPESIESVPITYGCGPTLDKIAKTLSCIEREFELKGVKMLVSNSLLRSKRDENGNIMGRDFDEDLFVRIADNDNADDIVVFDPAIRDSAYYTKLERHFAMLEKEIGCSKGILTDLATQNATATEIRRSMNATFCLTDDMRKEYVKYFDTLMYSLNVLCNFYSITPISEYKINFDWGYSLLEDSEQTFRQLIEGKANKAIKAVEIRQFLKPDETPEDAQKAINEIAANEPSFNDVMGE